MADRPEIILHAVAIVSGEVEADFEKGYRVNVTGTRYLFEAVRKSAYMPRLIFTSSIAVDEKISPAGLAMPDNNGSSEN
jgi:D-erythronate 2-dehydrogenase